MKRLFGLDQTYQELRQMGMLDNKFERMPTNLLRRYIRTLINTIHTSTSIKQLKEIIKILSESNKNSYQSIKNLVFFNMIINESAYTDKANIEGTLTEEINKIITVQKERYEAVQKTRTKKKSNSLEKASNWIKQRFSKSKQKMESPTRIKRSISQSLKVGVHQKTKTQITQPNLQNSHIEQEKFTQGKQEMLITKVILPYASYLLKCIVAQINFRWASLQNLPSVHIWKVINLLKSLFKISESFPTILRYYTKQYLALLLVIIRNMDYDIKILSPILQTTLNTKGSIIKKEAFAIYQSSQPQKKKIQMLEEIISKFEINQYKQILHEICAINQSISHLYLGKYLYSGIMGEGLRQPVVFQDASKYDFVFDIMKEVEKSKSISKRLSGSKDKTYTPRALKFDQSIRLKKQMVNMSTTFGERRLRIMKERSPRMERQEMVLQENKQIQIQTPTEKASPTETTFRKIRKNNTNHNSNNMQNSDTSRLKL